jgi:hypothetical protein
MDTMGRFVVRVVIIAVTPLWFSGCCCFSCLSGGGNAGISTSRSVTVTELVDQVQVAVDNLDKNPINGFVLKSAEITVATEKVTTAEGKVALVISTNASRARMTGQTLSFTLRPSGSSLLKSRSVGNELANSIRAAMQEIQSSNLDNYHVTDFSATAAIKATDALGGGVEFEFSGASIAASSEVSNANTTSNTIKLSFGQVK